MITPEKCTIATNGDKIRGVVACKLVDIADILASLAKDTVVDLFKMSQGDLILSAELNVLAASTAASALVLGVDADLAGTAAPAGLLASMPVDSGATLLFKSNDTVADATAPTYCGPSLDKGFFTCLTDGYVTIKTLDVTLVGDATLTGSIKLFYIPG